MTTCFFVTRVDGSFTFRVSKILSLKTSVLRSRVISVPLSVTLIRLFDETCILGVVHVSGGGSSGESWSLRTGESKCREKWIRRKLY